MDDIDKLDSETRNEVPLWQGHLADSSLKWASSSSLATTKDSR